MAHMSSSQPFLGGPSTAGTQPSASSAATVTTGGQKKDRLLKVTLWVILVLVGWFVLAIMYSLVALIVGLPEIGRQWGAAFGEALGRFSAPASPVVTQEAEPVVVTDIAEKLAAGLKPLQSDLAQKWLRAGRAERSRQGWDVPPTELRHVASGHAGIEGPLLNCDFMDDYSVAVHEGRNWGRITGFTGDDAYLVDSRGDSLLEFRRLTPVTVDSESGLLYLRVVGGMIPGGFRDPFSFDVRLIPLKKADRPFRVREACYRLFLPTKFASEVVDWGKLPFQFRVTPASSPVLIGFTIRVRLSRLPHPGEPVVVDWQPDETDLDQLPVRVSFMVRDSANASSHDGQEIFTRIASGALVEVTSAEIRDTWESDDRHPETWLRVESAMPVRVDVAVMIHGGR